MIERFPPRVSGDRRIIAAGLFVLAAFVLITFYPTLKIGFWGDDWWLVANAGRLDLAQYLRFYFDPLVQTIWYRPAHGVLLLAEYFFWGSNAEGYHWVYMFVHLANSLLIFAIVNRISKNWQLGLISAILFAGFYPGSIAVFGIAVHDPLATLFYLLTVLVWLYYLATGRSFYFWLAIAAFILALLSKETSAALIVTMFLMDRIIVRQSLSLRSGIRRYALFALILLIYLAIEYRVQTAGHFSNRAGYGLGLQFVGNAFRYLQLLVLPWGVDQWAGLTWFCIALLLVGGLIFVKPRIALDAGIGFFLLVQVFLAIAPILGFPPELFEARYLYPASVVPAIVIAILFARRKPAVTTALFSAGLVMLILVHSWATADAAVAMTELNREQRVSFRDITQRHPTFPPDTFLYFINAPGALRHFAPSMFFFRYGTNVSVWSVDPQWWGTIDEDRVANLRDHKNSIVYYYDDAQAHELAVEPLDSTSASLQFPVKYQIPLQLNGYEVTRSTIKRGEAFVLLLYWQATASVNKDYTVFVHLLDRDGHMIAGGDSQPRNGQSPTSTWVKDKLVVDPHFLTIPEDARPGDEYYVEVGLYYLPTMEQVQIADPTNSTGSTSIVIRPFRIGE